MLRSRPSFPLFPRPVRILSDFSKGVDTPRLVLWQPLPLVVVVILVLLLLLRFLLLACTRLGAELESITKFSAAGRRFIVSCVVWLL